jgi:hypothetical protein
MITEEEIRGSLVALDHALATRGAGRDLFVWRGVMVLAFQARQSTKDVDAIFAPAGIIRDLAAEVGRERGLDEDWIDDGEKGFVSSRRAFISLGLNLPHLSVLMPVPEDLLAMKCMAARAGESARDMQDVKFLLRHLALKDAGTARAVVKEYYPASRITLKTQYFVEAAFEELSAESTGAGIDVSADKKDLSEQDARHSL